MTIIDEGVEFETVWSGATGWLNDKRDEIPPKLLNRVDYADLDQPRDPKPKSRGDQIHRSRAKERALLLELLPQKARWKVKDLRQIVGVDPATLSGLLDRLRRDGYVDRSIYGVVSLRPYLRKDVAA